MNGNGNEYQRIRVLVETDERSFKGFVCKPGNGETRLSDFLNSYDDRYLRMSDVEITDRGQHYRVGEKQPFVAVAVNAITFISPLDGD